LSRPSTKATNSYVDASVNGSAEVEDPANQSENVFLDFCHGVLDVNIQPSDISVCAKHRPELNIDRR